MNLLSVGASYGLLVLVFQKGFMIGFFGFDQVQINNMIDIMKTNQGSGSLNNPLLWIPKKLRMQALQKAHLTTAGGPTLHTMPGWMSKDWARPLTLFYRTAYQVTNNIIGNVMRPMYVEGNPFPMLKYTAGASITGASLYHLYNFDFLLFLG